SVAHELVEGAPVREDRLYHACMALVEHGDHLVTSERLTQGGEVTEVAEEDRHLAALASANVPILLKPRGHLWREVAPEVLPAGLLTRHAVHQADDAPATVREGEGGQPRCEDQSHRQADVHPAEVHEQ